MQEWKASIKAAAQSSSYEEYLRLMAQAQQEQHQEQHQELGGSNDTH
mgnify:CR=1 FL=1